MPSQSDGTELYSQVVNVATHYMGPVASRFVVRQIRTHLNKEPSKLEHGDLTELSKWITLELTLLTDNQTAVDEFAERLKQL